MRFACLLLSSLAVVSCQKAEEPVVEGTGSIEGVEVIEAPEDAGEIEGQSAEAFHTLLERCKMEFNVPSGFAFSPGAITAQLDYEGKLVSDDGKLEVRIALRCLADAEVDYKDPHSSKPAPEHIYPLMYTAIVQEVSTDPHSASGGFGDNALAEFHADWGQMSLLTPKPEFGGDYSSMIFLAVHRRAAADAYMVFLFDEYAEVKDQVKAAMGSLHFSDVPEQAESTEQEPTEVPLHVR
jgi:hypothetical protein